MKHVLAVTALVLTGSIVFAHTGATGIVKERMDGMGVLASAMKTLGTMAKSGDLDASAIRQASQTIQAHSGEALSIRFPEGSLPHVSEAAPLIWTDWDRFTALSTELHTIAAELEAQAGAPDLDLGQFVRSLGATCSDCHRDFRIKK